MSRNFRKRTVGYVHPAKIQISLLICEIRCAIWAETSLDTFWIAKNTKIFLPDNED